ncbi:hypothetical protein CPB83DRAFT_863922 [Crepidotus variabilis]|uniref:Uncharacterized protein n=1 Tax=Crepidotus variabilis TaxID=179855 RepID=A0A9P6JJ96_9AGAR|nr:hypothetical protein CPB83DRAFT_863922 [Crepidotus variabilis]
MLSRVATHFLTKKSAFDRKPRRYRSSRVGDKHVQSILRPLKSGGVHPVITLGIFVFTDALRCRGEPHEHFHVSCVGMGCC